MTTALPHQHTLRPGQDPASPHCDLYVHPASADNHGLLQLASLHRAAEVARFQWRRQHPHLDPANPPPPPTAQSTDAATATNVETPNHTGASPSRTGTGRSLASAHRSDRRVYNNTVIALNAAQSTFFRQQQRQARGTASGSGGGGGGGGEGGDPSIDLATRIHEFATLLDSDSGSGSESETDRAGIAATPGRRPDRGTPRSTTGGIDRGMGTTGDRRGMAESRSASPDVQRLWRELRERERQLREQHRQLWGEQRHTRQQPFSPLQADAETEWQCWDRLVKDLAPCSELRELSDQDTASTAFRPYHLRNTTLSGLAISFLSHQAQNETQSGRSISLPHPIWSRRYKGPAGVWLRNELTRRSQAPLSERLPASGAGGGAISFPSLDPEQRPGNAAAGTASSSNVSVSAPAAAVQAATPQDWSSFLLPSSATLQSLSTASAMLAARVTTTNPTTADTPDEDMQDAQAALTRTAQSVEAHLQVSRMAQAVRSRGLEPSATAATTYGSRNRTAASAAGSATRSGPSRPRSTRDALAFLNRLRAQDGLLPGSAASNTNSGGGSGGRSTSNDRSSQSTGLDTPTPFTFARPQPASVATTLAPAPFDPDGSNMDAWPDAPRPYPSSSSTSFASPYSAANLAATGGLLDPDGECYSEAAPRLPSGSIALRREADARRAQNRSARVMADDGPPPRLGMDGARSGDEGPTAAEGGAPSIDGWYLVPSATSAITGNSGRGTGSAALDAWVPGEPHPFYTVTEPVGPAPPAFAVTDESTGRDAPTTAATNAFHVSGPLPTATAPAVAAQRGEGGGDEANPTTEVGEMMMLDNPIRRTSPLPLANHTRSSSSSTWTPALASEPAAAAAGNDATSGLRRRNEVILNQVRNASFWSGSQAESDFLAQTQTQTQQPVASTSSSSSSPAPASALQRIEAGEQRDEGWRACR
ncbi:uncharacterized protein PFL1_05215 [Pseudozyma flocculosa PF-1]|uniref:Uncharacterized protein n=2 Tax=Pseudozyma flocculosa TaxID=84751 RepID=A0A5C3F585_9BASI|nr:uncharacterized protein PFL1_05215 [Pseudozyma flocculosa PF-1]EPQ27292.1 hypothetical protein PFL1_05215 [Pseudozyma flocculosa PF-1]SPO39663.1 uncharacterized protein PSFLO_05144 [Pseudozyma flocculosa]